MLKISHVSKTFNKGTVNEKKALSDLNLTIEDGDFITVIGGNGAGKSTLLNLIAGVYPPDCGHIVLNQREIALLPEHKRAKFIGRVFQDPLMGTAADMEIAENLSFAARRGQRRTLRWGSTKQEHEKFKKQLAELGLGLEDRLTSKVGLLSGGQRQALTLLMASLQKPELLLLDEHTAALDPLTAKIVLDLTQKIVEADHLTTVMITHNMNDAIRMGNRLIMLYNGKIIYDVRGAAKKALTVEDLHKKFTEAAGTEFSDDRAVLI